MSGMTGLVATVIGNAGASCAPEEMVTTLVTAGSMPCLT